MSAEPTAVLDEACHVMQQRTTTDCRIEIAGGIANERISADGRIVVSGVANERESADGSVLVAGDVAAERFKTDGRVVAAGSVARERTSSRWPC